MRTLRICVAVGFAALFGYLDGIEHGKKLADHWWERHIVDYIPTIRVEPPPAPYMSVGFLLTDGETGFDGTFELGTQIGIVVQHSKVVTTEVSPGGWTIKDIDIDGENKIISGCEHKAH